MSDSALEEQAQHTAATLGLQLEEVRQTLLKMQSSTTITACSLERFGRPRAAEPPFWVKYQRRPRRPRTLA